MAIWLRIVLIVALAILLWILVVDLTRSVDEVSGSQGPPAGAASPG